VICPNCGTEMEMFGVLETGARKYICSKCFRIETKDRRKDVKNNS